MKREPEFIWNEQAGIATCVLEDDKGRNHVGVAACHPEDRDMMTDKVGCEIALRRAEIEALRSYIRDDLKPGLAALNQLYYSIKHSKKFTPKSYESIMLYRQIRQKEEDIALVKEMIEERKSELRFYIDAKEHFYQITRKGRELEHVNEADNN